MPAPVLASDIKRPWAKVWEQQNWVNVLPFPVRQNSGPALEFLEGGTKAKSVARLVMRAFWDVRHLS